ncbi:hypothetical protein [Paraburkholderia hayleyella]|uniref:hypothetical protein n=1 Tax=Paraburkholderia hayleyella TaxID=2152889 RepID=UPI001580B4FC|nr:hypothetical protein [Paraburkholderia hayleyella]
MTPVKLTATRALMILPMLVPKLVGKEKCHDQQGYDQENAEYQIFDHDNLQTGNARLFYCRQPFSFCRAIQVFVLCSCIPQMSLRVIPNNFQPTF